MMVVVITKLMSKQIHIQILNLNVEFMGNGNVGNVSTFQASLDQIFLLYLKKRPK